MRYVTIKDIAKALGISKSTVSRALSGDERNVGKETLRKIREKANEMGYHRNELAVNLRSNTAHVIGVVVPEITTPFSMSFIASLQRYVAEEGYKVNIAFSNENPRTEREVLEMFVAGRVDGLVVSTCHNKENLDYYRRLIANNFPLVFFDRTIPEINASNVHSNDYIKAFFMVEHLIRTGKKKILHIAGPGYIQNSYERLRGYRDALEKFKIPYKKEYILKIGVGVEEAAQVLDGILTSGNLEFDALFCFTETQALGAKRAIQEHGLLIPSDVAIACMSGTALSTLVYPQLTAVEQRYDEMAKEAARLIIKKINDPYSEPETIVVSSVTSIRSSTSTEVPQF